MPSKRCSPLAFLVGNCGLRVPTPPHRKQHQRELMFRYEGKPLPKKTTKLFQGSPPFSPASPPEKNTKYEQNARAVFLGLPGCCWPTAASPCDPTPSVCPGCCPLSAPSPSSSPNGTNRTNRTARRSGSYASSQVERMGDGFALGHVSHMTF